MEVEDTYENRALFMVMWHGAVMGECKKMFPKWHAKAWALKHGSSEETFWWCKFAEEALRLKGGGAS